MAVSKNRLDWALLLLRVGLGILAVLQALPGLLHLRSSLGAVQAGPLGVAIGQIVAGGLLVVGAWTTPAALLLAALKVWPLVGGWRPSAFLGLHGPALCQILIVLACALGGGGRFSLRRD